MIIKKQFKITQYNHKYWGILYIPDNLVGKVPIVIFYHGTGETGSTESSADRLYNNGPLNFIRTGWRPNFMVLAMQSSSWTPTPRSGDFVTKNDPDIIQRWDGKALITGLSAGGSATYGFMNEVGNTNFSYIPMSPAGDGKLISPEKPWKLWAFAGDNDGQFTNSAKLLAQQTEGRLTIYKGGHCCWNTYYSPNYKEVIDGKSMNIYDWAFNQTPSVPSTTTTTTKLSTTSTTTKAPKSIKSITITYSDGSVEVINS